MPNDPSPAELNARLLIQERELTFRLKETSRTLGRLGIRPQPLSPHLFAAAVAVPAADPQDEIRAIYYVLLDLFEQDNKIVDHVTPETALGEYPLGYDKTSLQSFYDQEIYQRFSVRISANVVKVSATVWDLTKAIHAKGGRA